MDSKYNIHGFTTVLARLFFLAVPYTIKRKYLVLASSLLFAVVLNTSFFTEVFKIYPMSGAYALFLIGLFMVVFGATFLVLTLLCFRYLTKPILVLLLIVSSLSNYFMGQYGILMNTEMLTNILETSPAESFDLVNPILILNLLVFGVLPSIVILKLRIDYESIWKGLLSKLVMSVSMLALIVAALFSSAPTFASFFREHKQLRYHANPLAFIYSVGRLASESAIDAKKPLVAIGQDARIESSGGLPKLIVFVLGETARADRFSLNGYHRITNPLLAKEDIVNLTNVMAAGTSTATSVPLMFSPKGRTKGNLKEARRSENLLDVLNRVGVSVLWRDNNSDSKGVALRVPYEDFKDESVNPPIDGEPRDEGMLNGLQDYIDDQDGDIFVVLHQMGSHGPDYFKRYPKSFEVYAPVCRSNQLEKCSKEEIDNAYDNSILYTDYFLSKVIGLLKNNDSDHQTAMLYFSDHGESLGENNLYLHGYPYALAPMEQKHVPAVLWFGKRFLTDKKALKKQESAALSHDNIFHTVLGIFQVVTREYRGDMDLIRSGGGYCPVTDLTENS